MTTRDFQDLIWEKGRELYRDMPWRQDTRPYYVMVSELMLQQTQVVRVIPKFEAFIAAFPDEKTLAGASLADVLRRWQGLGYNRRAKYLHDAARVIMDEYNGVWPETVEQLVRLPGIGPNTAGAIMTYAFNSRALFIETNVRTVYFHHFFPDEEGVKDGQIRTLLEETVDSEHPREFYWALMDYGSWLKANGVKNISRAHGYKKQSPLEGSVRQMRGAIVAALADSDLEESVLQQAVRADNRFTPALEGLVRDGLVVRNQDILHLTK